MWNPNGGSYRRITMTTFIQDESGATTIEYGVFFTILTSIFYVGASSLSTYVEQTFQVL
jgi:Flp pilus assembly pilin Flp